MEMTEKYRIKKKKNPVSLMHLWYNLGAKKTSKIFFDHPI